MRYRYYCDSKNRVYCVSTYAGRVVKASAACDPEDVFNEEIGKNIAKTRVDAKIASKRVNRALAKCEEARKQVENANNHLKKMECYLNDSIDKYYQARSNEALALKNVSE